jgi:ADP-dependent phosphofructokinase/glucokinase
MNYKNLDNTVLKLPKIRVATGLYAHWDSVLKINPNLLNWIDKTEKTEPRDTVLESLEEVAYTLDKAVKGEGREYLISEDVYEKINMLFPKREIRFGGNGFNMGNMLFLSGLKPVISYPSRSKRLIEASPDIDIVVDGSLKKPKEAVRFLDPDYDHIIIELENNRHILSWDPSTSQGLFDYDFLKYATTTKNIDLLIISYAHMLLPKYKKKTEEIIDLLKDEDRPKMHMELGLGSKESVEYAMKKFSESNYCDSWGMSEEECKVYLKSPSDSIEDMKEAALNAIKEYNVDRICVHTHNFAFVVSKYAMAKEYRALTAACVYAAARTFGELRLDQAKGLPTAAELMKEKMGKYNFCLVPCLFNNFPKVLTGIGDGFAAIQAVKILD